MSYLGLLGMVTLPKIVSLLTFSGQDSPTKADFTGFGHSVGSQRGQLCALGRIDDSPSRRSLAARERLASKGVTLPPGTEGIDPDGEYDQFAAPVREYLDIKLVYGVMELERQRPGSSWPSVFRLSGRPATTKYTSSAAAATIWLARPSSSA